MTEVIFDNGFKRISVKNTGEDGVRLTIKDLFSRQEIISAFTLGEVEQLVADLNHVLDSVDIVFVSEEEKPFNPNSRPDGAAFLSDVKRGVRLWHVYGTHPKVPEWQDGEVVDHEPVIYREMVKIRDGHYPKNKDSSLTDTYWYKAVDRFGFNSCDDMNLVPNKYNNHYLFTSYDKAVKYANACRLYQKL